MPKSVDEDVDSCLENLIGALENAKVEARKKGEEEEKKKAEEEESRGRRRKVEDREGKGRDR